MEIEMKKFLLLLITFLTVSNIFAFERTVLAEIFTSTTCGPCAAQNPYFDSWYKNYSNKDRVAVIKYHVWWPSPGNDPFYLANTTENAGRTNYYSTNYVPRGIINGTSDGSSSASTWIILLQNSMITSSQFEIKILGNVNAATGGNLTIQVTSDNNPIPSGTLVLHVAVVESDINYTGPNGDPKHNFVMRKMYPNHNGEVFTINPNETKTFSRVFSWNSNWNLENSHIVAFIQNRDTKEVYQAAIRRANIFVATPQLIHPPNKSLNQPVTISLNWAKNNQAIRYGLEVATDSLFTNKIFSDSTLVDTFKTLVKLSRGTIYYWRVRAIASYGSSDWSEVWSFKTLPLNVPNQVQLMNPPNDTIIINPGVITFSWLHSEPDVDAYRFEYATNNTFNNPVIDTILSDTTISINLTYMMSEYNYWRVTARNGVGWSEPSPIWNLRILRTSVDIDLNPDKFFLYQNYPNPFNPSTIIKFNLPKDGFTTLKIFDLYGKEITTLIKENLSAGTYELKFSTEDLNDKSISSGVYFYQLKSGNYSEIRKMILLK